MAVVISKNLSPVAKIFDRPVTIALILSGLLVVWLAWQGGLTLIDHPIPADKISSHKIRVNAGGLTALNKDFDTYQNPAAAQNPPANLLTKAPQ